MKQIFKNLLTLSVSEIITKILGLITAAYVARVIAPEGFGILSFAAAFSSYFALFATFGLDIYGSREVARSQNFNREKIDSIFSLRLLLSAIVFIVYVGVVFISGNPGIIKIVLIITGINIFITASDLSWFYKAVEKMRYVAARRILISLLTLGGVVFLVNSRDDIFTAVSIPVVAGVINSILFISIYGKLRGRLKFVFRRIAWGKILKESFPLLFSSLMIAVYYNLDIVMLGYMKSQPVVGIYSAAYKIFLTGIIPFGLILNSFFPSLSRVGLNKNKELNSIIKNYFMLLFFSGIICALALFFGRDLLIRVVFGAKYSPASIPLSILSLNAAVISLNMFFGNPLIAWGRQKEYSLAITAGALTNVILNVILIPEYSYTGAAFATLISEVVVFCGVIFLFTKVTKNILFK